MTEDAQTTDVSAAGEQAEIDAEMAASAKLLRESGQEREADLQRRGLDADLDRRAKAVEHREEQATQQEATLDDRQWAADERDRLFDLREVQLGERERVADQREIDREITAWNDMR
ncbi:hypothetical protein [Actinoplanes sp. DH11]|uniref:hypothetical protein n=1 Tax=Actinoplanes sp. DH11 TaxID=2857011 RepID=UPI001E4F83B6|nr:hypothetical protein [Actinoplanes sp. DH11]